MPKVSVIIPSYNSAKYLSEAIDSALNQTFKDFELIVVDDGSTDNTAEILSKYGNKIRCFSQENKGVSAARNRGIRESKGEYIAFLDSDDIWLPKKLELQMQKLSNNPEYTWSYCDKISVFEDGIKEEDNNNLIKPLEGYIFDHLLVKNFIPTPSVIIKRGCFESAGLFDENLLHLEDYDLFLRLAKDYPISFVNKKLFIRRVHQNSICRTWKKITYFSHLKVLNNFIANNKSFLRRKKSLIYHRFGNLHYKIARLYFLNGESKLKVVYQLLLSMRYLNKMGKSGLLIFAILFSDIETIKRRITDRWQWN